jgi:hypothetical protein
MIQSRFFHSSIQEIELHVKEIHSLQGELREKILTSLNKSSCLFIISGKIVVIAFFLPSKLQVLLLSTCFPFSSTNFSR